MWSDHAADSDEEDLSGFPDVIPTGIDPIPEREGVFNEGNIHEEVMDTSDEKRVSYQEAAQEEMPPPDERPDQVVQESLTVEEAAAPSWWERFWRRFSPVARRQELLARIDDLSAMIEHNPDAGPCYVLRGEAYLQLKQYELASMDFQNALAIVIHEVENTRWGVIAQGLQDRAYRGLEKANLHLDDTHHPDRVSWDDE